MRLLRFLLFLLAPICLRAQYCGTTLNPAQLQVNNPSSYQQFVNFQDHVNNYAASQGGQSARLVNQDGLIIIPVVVHVLHQGEAIGTGWNISMAQIQSQIDALNDNFRRLNPDRVNTPAAFQGVAADFNIEFRLACVDPNGNSTNGVTRQLTDVAEFDVNWLSDYIPDDATAGIKTAQHGTAAWPTDRYLNIWVCNLKNFRGYSTFPWNFATIPQFDGIVCDAEYFGKTGSALLHYREGDLATHEIGHWLGLLHIWGDAQCGDDLVADTPTQETANEICYGNVHITCGNGPNGDMYMNYMDYTNDDCTNMFTLGQSQRARACFATVNGVPGPRVQQMENWFMIPPQTVRCKEIVRLRTLYCINTPVTWTVISGPAIAIPTSNNNEVIIQATANGTVILQAQSGNYVTEGTITVNTNAIPILALAQQASCNSVRFSVWGGMYDSYTWTTISGDLDFGMNSPTTLPYSDAYGTFGYAEVTATNACGTSATTGYLYYSEQPHGLSSISLYQPYPEPSCYESNSFYIFKALAIDQQPQYYEWGYRLNGGLDNILTSNGGQYQPFLFPSGGSYQVFARPVSDCGTGGEVVKYIEVSDFCFGGWERTAKDTSNISVYPNPAQDYMTVKIDQTAHTQNSAAKLQNKVTEIRTVHIYDKIGRLVKVQKFAAGNKLVTVSTAGLKTDIYTIEISDGVNKERKLISVKK